MKGAFSIRRICEVINISVAYYFIFFRGEYAVLKVVKILKIYPKEDETFVAEIALHTQGSIAARIRKYCIKYSLKELNKKGVGEEEKGRKREK